MLSWRTPGPLHKPTTRGFSSVLSLSCVTLHDSMNLSTPGLSVHHQLLQSTQTHVHQVGDAIQPSHPLSSPSPPAPNPSQHQGLFQWVNSSLEVAKVLEFQLQHQSFKWIPRTNLLQDGSSCSPRDSLECSPIPQFKSIHSLVLSFLHCPTLTSIHDYWKTTALTRWTFVGKVMSLLLNMLSRLVIIFHPRSKRLLISWLQSPSAVILEPRKIKSDTVSTVSPSISHEVMEPVCRRHHPYGRKWRGTKTPLDECEGGEWKSWLKAQHSGN